MMGRKAGEECLQRPDDQFFPGNACFLRQAVYRPDFLFRELKDEIT